jgi:bacillithiol biosynthesis deacetylase BshB1
MSEPLDILAFGAHADDVELSCGGTLLAATSAGARVGVVDLTRGELGTRGTPEIRAEEARRAAEIMGLAMRENLGLADGFFRADRESIEAVIRVLRAWRPRVVLANALDDRHPDHARGGDLVAEAVFLSGLRRVETERDGRVQEPHRPEVVYRYIQDRYIPPQLVVDITDHIEGKMAAIDAYASQFHEPASPEPMTYIATPEFREGLRARAREHGRLIGAHYGEGFTVVRPVGVRGLLDLR